MGGPRTVPYACMRAWRAAADPPADQSSTRPTLLGFFLASTPSRMCGSDWEGRQVAEANAPAVVAGHGHLAHESRRRIADEMPMPT